MKYRDGNNYPEVYLSEEVEAILNKKPVLPKPPVEPSKPEYPTKPDLKNPYWIIAIIAAAVFMLIFSAFDDPPGIIVVLGVLSCITFLVSIFLAPNRGQKNEEAKKQYEYDIWKYQESVKKYDEDLKKYAKARGEYDSNVIEMTSTRAVNNYRKEEMTRYLKNRITPIFENYSGNLVKKGKTDDDFASLLDISYNVLRNRRIPAGEAYYYPDILIACDNIYIDIEIDEPYSEEDGEPIHYLERGGFSVDFSRNCYMNEMGFEVIRFSEEQICTHINDCVAVIQSVINSIKNGKSDYDCPSGFSMAKWNWDQARKLAEKQYRHTYMTKMATDRPVPSIKSVKVGFVPTGHTETLSESEKKSIQAAVIRHSTVKKNEDNKPIVRLVVMYKSGRAKAFDLSEMNEQFPSGTKIDIDSIVFEEVMDSEGNTTKQARCKAI